MSQNGRCRCVCGSSGSSSIDSGRGRKARIVILGAAFLIGGLAPVNFLACSYAPRGNSGPLTIEPGLNFLKTTPESYTTIDIPQGFFGSKQGVPSDPIKAQVVRLEGRPIGQSASNFGPSSNVELTAGGCHSKGGHHHCHAPSAEISLADTITQINGTTVDKVGGTANLELKIVALSLQTPRDLPLRVTFGQASPSSYQVSLDLDPAETQPLGSIEVKRTKENGGAMRVKLPVKFRVTFTGGPNDPQPSGPVSLSTVLESTGNTFTLRSAPKPTKY